MGVKITDLVDPSAIAEIKNLNSELGMLVEKYTDVARELSKGIEVPVKNLEDLDKAFELYNRSAREAATISTQYNQAIERQKAIISETTNVASRRLMEQERMNKATRDEYAESQKVKDLLAQVNGTYEGNIRNLTRINNELESNKKQQADLKKQYELGRVSTDLYNQTLQNLIINERQLKQEKQTTNTLLKNEEREMQSVVGSYNHMSQQLELLKKAFKNLNEEERDSDLGIELETTIQNLDAHLKDLAADMGEFQRNVGNYAIAGQNGVVSTESLVAVLEKQAVTTKDLTDQNKILADARGMLDQADANYTATLDQINAKIAENERRLSDVSDIMEKQATSVAEAETQNQRLTAALKQVDLSSAEAAEQTAALNAKIAENNKIIEENSGKQTSLKKDLKEMVLEIANLSIQYNSLSAAEQESADGKALKSHIDDLIERAGVLKDAISDTNAAITNAASDTRAFDQVGEGIQLAIDGFGLATGAAQMLGISEGELAEIQTKLQAAIAASNAMQSIQNTLQKQSALMQGVNLVQTKLRTAAENMHTAAQGRGVIATKALTVAQWAFNAAAKANPIGLLVAGIVACAAAAYGLIKAFNYFFDSGEKAKQNYENQKKAVDDLTASHERQIEVLESKGATEAEVMAASLDFKNQERAETEKLVEYAKEAYDEDSQEYLDALEAKKKADEDYKATAEDDIDYLNKIKTHAQEKERENELGTFEYKRVLVEEEMEMQRKLAKKLLDNGDILRNQYADMLWGIEHDGKIKLDKINEDEIKSKNNAGKSRVDAAKKEAEELKKAIQAGEDALVRIIQDSLERQRKTEDLSYARKLKELQDQLSKTKAKQIQLRKAINTQIEALEVEHRQKLAEIEESQISRTKNAQMQVVDSRLAAVKEGSQEELDLMLEKLKIQQSMELDAIKKAEKDKTITYEQALEMRANLVETYAQKETDTIEDHAEKQLDAVQKKFADEEAERSNSLLNASVALKQEYAEELKAAGNNAEKRAAITENYERRAAELQYQYAHETADAAVKSLESQLNVEGLSADEQEKIRRQLAEARMKISDMETSHEIEQNEKGTKEYADEMEKRKAAVMQWLQVASDSLNAVNDLAQAIYDAKIQRVEEEQEANEASAEKESALISDLVEKKVITQEEGDARQRALDERKAKKDEELERKKQKLKHKQAIWDKANSLAQAAIATALAVMIAAQTKPFLPMGLAMTAVASTLGAIQMATIAATPIPKYAKGTDRHPGGPAIVGDGGRQEVVMFNGRAWLTPDTPTPVDLPQGAVVIPSIEDIPFDLPNPKNGCAALPQITVNNDNSVLCNKIDRLGQKIDGVARTISKSIKETAYLADFERYKNSRL